MIRLAEDETLAISSDDLCECYYTFQVSDHRAARNAIGTSSWGHGFEDFSCYDAALKDSRVYLCFGTLAMGDSLAVEIAQQSHYNVLKLLGNCMRDDEVLQYRKPIPRAPF